MARTKGVAPNKEDEQAAGSEARVGDGEPLPAAILAPAIFRSTTLSIPASRRARGDLQGKIFEWIAEQAPFTYS
jgi:hypothetical protein